MLDFKIDLMSKNTDELIKKYENKTCGLREKVYILTYLDDFIMTDNEICDKLIALCYEMKKRYDASFKIKDYDLMIRKLEEEKEIPQTDKSKRVYMQLETMLKDIKKYINNRYYELNKDKMDDILKSLVFIEKVHINQQNIRIDLDLLMRSIHRKSFEHNYDETIKTFDIELTNPKYKIKTNNN